MYCAIKDYLPFCVIIVSHCTIINITDESHQNNKANAIAKQQNIKHKTGKREPETDNKQRNIMYKTSTTTGSKTININTEEDTNKVKQSKSKGTEDLVQPNIKVKIAFLLHNKKLSSGFRLYCFFIVQ